MAYAALSAFVGTDRMPPAKPVVTVVLPGGCNLNCPFCIVAQRAERIDTSFLSSDHLVATLDAIDRRGFLGAAAIVGDEPLQSHCWPMAEAFLRRASESNAPTALITNGYNLVDFIEQLRRLENTKILVSLDAASEKHDEIRRKPGAFARISKGLKAASEFPDLRERLSIATILMPGNLDTIRGIIDFTAENKIPQLLVSPLLTSSRSTPLTVHPRIMREAWKNLPALLKHADGAGIRLRVSDEFAMLGDWEERLKSVGLEVLSPKARANLIRIDAAGRIETLDSMRTGTPTGLTLPTDVDDIDGFAAQIVGLCTEQVSAAA